MVEIEHAIIEPVQHIVSGNTILFLTRLVLATRATAVLSTYMRDAQILGLVNVGVPLYFANSKEYKIFMNYLDSFSSTLQHEFDVLKKAGGIIIGEK